MAATWDEVSTSEQFKSLDATDQESARQQYFNSVVMPQVPKEHQERARYQFDRDTAQTVSGQPKGNLLDKAAGVISDVTGLGKEKPAQTVAKKYTPGKYMPGEYGTEYDDLINRSAAEYDIEPNMLYAIGKHESKLDPKATSYTGVKGLYQITGDTAKTLQRKHPEIKGDHRDPEVSARLGAANWSDLMKRFDGNVRDALMAYNGGANGVERWIKNGRPADGKGLSIRDKDHQKEQAAKIKEVMEYPDYVLNHYTPSKQAQGQPQQPPGEYNPRSAAAQKAANEAEWRVIKGVIKRVPESGKALVSSGMQALYESPIGDTLAGLQKGLGMLSGMPGSGSSTLQTLGKGAGEEFGQDAQQEWKNIQNRMQELRQEATQGSKAAEYAYDVGSVITDMGAAIGVGLVTGNPGLVVPLMGGQAATGTYAGRRAAGEDPGMAAISSGVTGTIEALTEMIPVGFLFARTGALEKILKVTVGEGLQESFSSIFQSLWDSQTITPDMTYRQAFDAAVHEFTIGAGAGAGISTAMATYEAATGEASKNKAFKGLLNDVANTYVGDVDAEVVGSLTPGAGPGGASETPTVTNPSIAEDEDGHIEGQPLEDAAVEHLGKEPVVERRERISVSPIDETDRRSGDRRIDSQLREKVAAMTPEEQYQAIYVDRMTGLHNRRAFEDLPWRNYLASIDVDSLKWVNDTMSPTTGDQMLSEVGKAIEEAIWRSDTKAVDGYHISGDEYYVQADTKEDAEAILNSANEILATKVLEQKEKGITKEGINITWGTSTHKDLADQLMKDQKVAKEAKGERAGRGETPPGVTITPTDEEVAATAEEGTATAEEDLNLNQPEEDLEASLQQKKAGVSIVVDEEGAPHWEPETNTKMVSEVSTMLDKYTDSELNDVDSDLQSIARIPSENFYSDDKAVHQKSIDDFRNEAATNGWVQVGESKDGKHLGYTVPGKDGEMRNVEVYKMGGGMGWAIQTGVPEKEWKKATQVPIEQTPVIDSQPAEPESKESTERNNRVMNMIDMAEKGTGNLVIAARSGAKSVDAMQQDDIRYAAKLTGVSEKGSIGKIAQRVIDFMDAYGNYQNHSPADLQEMTVKQLAEIQGQMGLKKQGKKEARVMAIYDAMNNIRDMRDGWFVKLASEAEQRSKAAKGRADIKVTDDMETAIIKLGGLSWVESENHDIDWNNSIPGIGPLVRSEDSGEGDTMDGLAERLSGEGFDVSGPAGEYDANTLAEWFRTGEIAEIYTAEGLTEQMDKEARDREQDIRDQAMEDSETREVEDLAVLIDLVYSELGDNAFTAIEVRADRETDGTTDEDYEETLRRIIYEELDKKREGGEGEAATETGAETGDLGGEADQEAIDRNLAETEAERRRREAESFDLDREDVPLNESEDQATIWDDIPGFDEPVGSVLDQQATDLVNLYLEAPYLEDSQEELSKFVANNNKETINAVVSYLNDNKESIAEKAGTEAEEIEEIAEALNTEAVSETVEDADTGQYEFKEGDKVVVKANELYELPDAVPGTVTGPLNDAGYYPVTMDFVTDETGFYSDQGHFLPADLVPAEDYDGDLAIDPNLKLESMAGTVAMTPGNQYMGMIEQPYVPAGPPQVPKEEPIRREDILRPLLKAFGRNLYEGGIKSAQTLGYYRPGGGEVRVKKKSDLEVTAHELAHHIDDIYFGGFKKKANRPWIKGQGSKVFAAELKSLSYDETKVYEGFAEFVRHWMTNPASLTNKAPNFLKWFDNYVDNHEKGQHLRNAQAGMVAWYNQPLVQQARSKIGQTRTLNSVNDSIWDNFRQSYIDRSHGLLLMENTLTGRKSAMKGGPVETARLAAHVHSIVDRALELGAPQVQPDGSFAFVGKGLKDILAPVSGEMEKWSLYAIGRSADELYEQGRENLLSRGQIDAMMDLETPEMKQVFDDWLEFTGNVVDFAVDMGFLSRDQVDGWRRQQYIPFYRIDRSSGPNWQDKITSKIFGKGQQGVGKRGNIPGQVTAIKMLTGGTENIGDIFNNMVMNTSMLIVESIKNDARRSAVNMAQRVEGGRNWITARPTGTKPVSIEREQIIDVVLRPMGMTYKQYEKALEMGAVDPELAIYIDGVITSMDEYEQFWLRGQAPNDPNIVAVKRDGKTFYYQINDDLVYRSFLSFDPPSKPAVNRVLSAIRRAMQGTVTLSLSFMGVNLWRDTQSGFVYTKVGFRPVVDSLKGLKSRITKDDTYRLAMANGMGMSSYLVDEGAMQRHVKNTYTQKGFTKRYLLDAPANMLYFLESMADAFEMSTRLGEFKRAIDKGEHPRHAAYLGTEISTDFTRRGDSEFSGFFIDAVPFLNAGIQGLDRGYRGITKDDQRRQVFYRIGAIASVGAILYAINRDDPCYKQLQDWDKDSSWHIFYGSGDCAEKTHFTLPKPWEIGAVASMAERMIEELILKPLNKEFPDIPDMGKHVARIFIEQFKMDWIPGGVEPLYEVYGVNRNRYFDTPIVSPSMKGEPYTQYTDRTPRSLVAFAELLKGYDPAYQFAPVRAEALIRGYFNSWGAFALTFVDEAFFGREKPAMNWTEYPVARRWARQGPRRTRYETEYYDLFKEGSQLQATINWAVDMNKPDSMETAMEKMERKNLFMATMLRSGINAAKSNIEKIYNDPDLSRDEKSIQINETRVELNKMYEQFITEYSDMVKPAGED